MNMKRKIRLVVCGFLALTLLLWATPVLAVPPIPHAFYGTVKINGVSAPAGTVVSAKINGEDAGSYTTTVVGQYGDVTTRDYLAVSCDDASDGDTITFYVKGHSTGQTAAFEVGGGPTEMDLRISIPSGGGGIVLAPNIESTLFGEEAEFSISADGEILETIEATSEDGNLTLTIEEGTIALDEDGNPLETLEAEVDENPPDPPEGAHILGAYNFGPDGATFDPPITLTWGYDPEDWPEGTDLVVAYWDGDEWVVLDEEDFDIDTENDTITVEVDHFTTFAIVAMPPPAAPPVLAPAVITTSSLAISPRTVDIGEAVSISLLMSNTGEEQGDYTVILKINGVVRQTKEVTLAGGASETVTFSVVEDEAGTYLVDVDGLTGSFTVSEAVVAPLAPPTAVPPLKTNWAMVGPIIGVVVFLAIFLPIRLRRRKRLG